MDKFITKLGAYRGEQNEQKMANFSLLKWRAIWGTRCGLSTYRDMFCAKNDRDRKDKER